MSNKTEQIEYAVLQRAFEREKKRRLKAEAVLEEKSRELYLSHEKLLKSNAALLNANNKVEHQKTELSGLTDSYGKVTRGLNIAAKAQLDLLPLPMERKELAACGVFKPAEFIAGDGYDYFMLNSDLFAFYVIDVAGHGISAAMVSFAVQLHLNPKTHGICKQSVIESNSIKEAVENTLHSLNKSYFHEDIMSPYFTMLYGIIELNTGMVTFGQAGHPAPLLYRNSDQSVTEYGTGGNPVAMFDSPVFGIERFQMQPRDRLIIYSDGATECFSKTGEEFGSERFAKLVREAGHLPLESACECFANELTHWRGEDIFEDDLSILQIEFRGLGE